MQKYVLFLFQNILRLLNSLAYQPDSTDSKSDRLLTVFLSSFLAVAKNVSQIWHLVVAGCRGTVRT